MESEDYANVFTSVSLADFYRVKYKKPDNFVHIISYVSELN